MVKMKTVPVLTYMAMNYIVFPNQPLPIHKQLSKIRISKTNAYTEPSLQA